MSRRAGYTLVEVAVTLVVVALVASIASASFSASRSATESRLLEPLLLAASGDVLRSASDGVFPADVADRLDAVGYTVAAGAPAWQELSLSRSADGSSVVVSAASSGRCLAFRASGASSVWFEGGSPSCLASEVAAAAAAATGGASPSAPEVLP